jgi:putative redox protein
MKTSIDCCVFNQPVSDPMHIDKKPGSVLAQTVHVRQHQFDADVSQAEGGADEGPNPHDLYDAALGACKALTVMWFARKKGIAVDDIHTEVQSDNSQERAGRYRITSKLTISGNFSDAEFAQLAAVAEKCPVHKLMTSVTTEIVTQVERAT